MRFKTFLILATVTLLPIHAFADCVPKTPKVDCIEELTYPKGPYYNKADAAKACKGGVLVECIQTLTYPAGPFYNKADAAKACKGGVTADCIDTLTYPKGPYYNKADAAKACSDEE